METPFDFVLDTSKMLLAMYASVLDTQTKILNALALNPSPEQGLAWARKLVEDNLEFAKEECHFTPDPKMGEEVFKVISAMWAGFNANLTWIELATKESVND